MTNGGPAFPGAQNGDDGMSLLDWFAGQVLSGLLASYGASGNFAEFSELAYKFAVAMLEQRETIKGEYQ